MIVKLLLEKLWLYSNFKINKTKSIPNWHSSVNNHFLMTYFPMIETRQWIKILDWKELYIMYQYHTTSIHLPSVSPISPTANCLLLFPISIYNEPLLPFMPFSFSDSLQHVHVSTIPLISITSFWGDDLSFFLQTISSLQTRATSHLFLFVQQSVHCLEYNSCLIHNCWWMGATLVASNHSVLKPETWYRYPILSTFHNLVWLVEFLFK